MDKRFLIILIIFKNVLEYYLYSIHAVMTHIDYQLYYKNKAILRVSVILFTIHDWRHG